jgi:hypothetical protein
LNSDGFMRAHLPRMQSCGFHAGLPSRCAFWSAIPPSLLDTPHRGRFFQPRR